MCCQYIVSTLTNSITKISEYFKGHPLRRSTSVSSMRDQWTGWSTLTCMMDSWLHGLTLSATNATQKTDDFPKINKVEKTSENQRKNLDAKHDSKERPQRLEDAYNIIFQVMYLPMPFRFLKSVIHFIACRVANWTSSWLTVVHLLDCLSLSFDCWITFQKYRVLECQRIWPTRQKIVFLLTCCCSSLLLSFATIQLHYFITLTITQTCIWRQEN